MSEATFNPSTNLGEQIPPTAPPAEAASPNSSQNNTNLYVGNLDVRVNEAMLFQIFSVIAPHSSGPVYYGFVEFFDSEAAESAITRMNKRKIFDFEISVNWAISSNNQQTEVQPQEFILFVGDLAPEVSEKALEDHFSQFPSLKGVKVMFDPKTNQSRGFGFVTFASYSDAENSIASLNGSTLGSRQIRVNWGSGNNSNKNKSFNNNNRQDFSKLSTVYCGNLDSTVDDEQIRSLFENYGVVTNVDLFADRGYAFVQMDSRDNASKAISALNGASLSGKNIVCYWRKESSQERGGNFQNRQQFNKFQNRNNGYNQNYNNNNFNFGSSGNGQFHQQRRPNNRNRPYNPSKRGPNSLEFDPNQGQFNSMSDSNQLNMDQSDNQISGMTDFQSAQESNQL
ncbi:hypothetical protein BB560_002267 [Smittium megazygosporum]|uniref:RRM domain-containing protein n=1 Tax=Smittium megazygosporum TaxID=133381 RepID=A0A2T9ZFB9_9FUNG|nr:hypothetical protein BB560_002267 [Smittium megazygosporum]